MENGKIYELIGKAMKEVGAIGKDSRNAQQGFMYRGIDAVYNALNPVMAKLGLFICPEILEQRREERTTQKGAVLIYTILTIRYTIYAPDGSSVSCTVIGEGMDSGDKSANKAMSVAMKYAMFQLLFIPTEAVDPDADVHGDVMPQIGAKDYIRGELQKMKAMYGISDDNQMMTKFLLMRRSLIDSGVIKDIASDKQTLEQAKDMIDAIYKNFPAKEDKK